MSQNEETQRFFLLRKDIMTVEPVAFLAFFSSVLSATASTSVALDKVCRIKLQIDDEICYDIQRETHPNDEYDQMVFDYFVLYSSWENIISCLLPCVLLLFVGGWSDRTGHRKVIMLLPVIGRTLQIVNSFISAIFYNQIPLEVHIFLNTFFVNVFGGSILMFFALFTYIIVTSLGEYRIYRITSICVCSATGALLGMSFTKIVRHIGYHPILGLSLIMNAMTSLYIIYKVSDPKRSNEEMMYDEQTVSEFLRNFFSFAYIKETAEVISRKTPDNRELHLCINVFSSVLIFSVFFGNIVGLHLIAKHNYEWDQQKLQSYHICTAMLSTIGLLITVGTITKWLKCHESVIGIVSSISKIISSFILCFFDTYVFYIGPLVEMFNGSSILAISSLTSRLLENKEVGKIMGLIFLFGNLVRLVYVPLYTLIHVMTRNTLPGALYLVGAAYTVPILFIYIWVLIDHRRDDSAV